MPKAYPAEFRRDVIAVARESGRSIRSVAKDFGISETCLQRWLRIADQDDFCTSIGGMGEHALHLACADHAGLVYNQHIAGGEPVPALSPAMFHAGDGA